MAINLDNYKDPNGNIQVSKSLIEDVVNGITDNSKLLDSERISFSASAGSTNILLSSNAFVLERCPYLVIFSAFDATGSYAGTGVFVVSANSAKLFSIQEVLRTSAGVSVVRDTAGTTLQLTNESGYYRFIRGKIYRMG